MTDYICTPCNIETEELVKDQNTFVCKECGNPMTEKVGATNLGGFDKLGRSKK